MAGRSAVRTSIAVGVDAHPCRVWLRNPRGSVPCPCSSASDASDATPLAPSGRADIILSTGDGDQLSALDHGFPTGGPTAAAGTDSAPDGRPDPQQGWIGDVARMLLGNGRRCGLCLGTGWIDGFRVHGGERLIFCAADTDTVTVTDGTEDPFVDLDCPTPTLVGPGAVEWATEIPRGQHWLDALRVRNGLRPSDGGWTLLARHVSTDAWVPMDRLLGVDDGVFQGIRLDDGVAGNPLQVRLELAAHARVSHVEMVTRSVPLVALQLPQLLQSASAELVGPILSEEFELDPRVGWIERGTILEVPGIAGRVGSVWHVTDVTVKRTAGGQIFGVTGTARNVQPTEVLAAASLEDALVTGQMDQGVAPRGLESSSGGEPMGLPVGSTDDSATALKRGIPERLQGGTSAGPTVVLLSPGDER
jgi:hypothetical protein